jgi:hypothetical protein
VGSSIGGSIASAAARQRTRTLAAVRLEFEELELPFHDLPELVEGGAEPAAAVCRIGRDPLGTFPCCPLCGGELRPEHAHFRCACGWRDSCCD